MVDWYNRYRDDGFVVIGVHTPEYAFERVPGNVASGAAALHINYPVALDNDYTTWNNYQNLYWPAEYLIDANGTVRHTKFGEGDYDGTEKLIRQLLSSTPIRTSGCPPPTNSVDTTPQTRLTPETYLGAGKAVNYGGAGEYKAGTATFALPGELGRRQVRPARPLDPGRPGRHRRQRRRRHPAELHRRRPSTSSSAVPAPSP